MKTILIVDDEPRTRLGIQKTLFAWSAGEYRVECASTGVEALQWLQTNKAEVVITDVRMPELDGLQMLEALASDGQLPVIIVISGYAEFDYARRALQLGVFEYLLKPLDKSLLISTVHKALELDSGRRRLNAMKKLIDPDLLKTDDDQNRFSPAIADAIGYVDENLGQPIGMRAVAEMLHLNASYFSVLFKEQTGVTFSQYVTRKRLQKAKELLAATHMPVWEIAESVGYQTAKYFIKIFKENEGASPTQYRNKMQDFEQLIQ